MSGYKEYLTKNRVLKIDEYDEAGNIIDTLEFSEEDLWMFCNMKGNAYRGLDVATKADREYFKGEELELFQKIIEKSELFRYCIVAEDVKRVEDIFKAYTKDEIRFALEFKNYFYNECKYAFYGEEEIVIKSKDFLGVLEWIKKSDGFYYAIDDKGDTGMAYINMPTKKQITYQRQKHKKSVVFLNFKDFKEYEI